LALVPPANGAGAPAVELVPPLDWPDPAWPPETGVLDVPAVTGIGALALLPPTEPAPEPVPESPAEWPGAAAKGSPLQASATPTRQTKQGARIGERLFIT
jgi:hypothetical protein